MTIDNIYGMTNDSKEKKKLQRISNIKLQAGTLSYNGISQSLTQRAVYKNSFCCTQFIK